MDHDLNNAYNLSYEADKAIERWEADRDVDHGRIAIAACLTAKSAWFEIFTQTNGQFAHNNFDAYMKAA